MKIAIYPGSFNPWHKGHSDILDKALKCFDNVIIAIGHNSEKELSTESGKRMDQIAKHLYKEFERNITVYQFEGLLVDFVKRQQDLCQHLGDEVSAVVRGLRNGHDLQYEMNQQYWNEDLGLTVPIIYYVCDRHLSHISSSTIRIVKALKE